MTELQSNWDERLTKTLAEGREVLAQLAIVSEMGLENAQVNIPALREKAERNHEALMASIAVVEKSAKDLQSHIIEAGESASMVEHHAAHQKQFFGKGNIDLYITSQMIDNVTLSRDYLNNVKDIVWNQAWQEIDDRKAVELIIQIGEERLVRLSETNDDVFKMAELMTARGTEKRHRRIK